MSAARYAGAFWLNLLLFLSIVQCASSDGLAQGSLQPLVVNGPVSNRLNIVVLSEGYTDAQLAKFLNDATNAVNALLANEPYQNYETFFNAFAIPVASAQQGSDHPNAGQFRDTYFDTTYDAATDRIITMPPSGQSKVDDLITSLMPGCDLSIVLVNDLISGGSDGFGLTAVCSIGALSPKMLVHETGHVLAGLGDEYTNAYPGFPATEEPNTTRETRRDLVKWKAWIASETPLPTPPTFEFDNVVGLFEGAHYNAKGWYRPSLNCAMRSISSPFCQVCREALVLSFYRHLRMVDGFSPANTNVVLSTAQPAYFAVDLLQPATHSLNVQWKLDGTPVAGATNLIFEIRPESIGDGSHNITADITDPTAMVRRDPESLLAQTASWNVTVRIVSLLLESPQWSADQQFIFRVTGQALEPVIVQESTNMLDWRSVATNSLAGGSFWHTNLVPLRISNAFYRVTASP